MSANPRPPSGRWWESNAAVLAALALLGPFALPLVWAHSRYRVATKVILTVVTVAVTVGALLVTRSLAERLLEALRELS